MKKCVALIILLIGFMSNAQQILSLDECYDLANEKYPLSNQMGLLKNKSDLEIQSILTAKLPKIDVNAQATYQSEVTQLPFSNPNNPIQPLNKDQYRATLEINQLLYNGGLIDAQTKLKEAQLKTQQQQLQVNLYQLKNRINQYYFSILLFQESKILLVSKKELLYSKIQEVKSAVKFGALLPASEQVLEAEIIKINQQLTEIDFNKAKLLQNLSELTATKIDSETVLALPTNSTTDSEGTRPEVVYYDLQNQQLELSKSILTKSNLPRVNAFAQAGYGNPGLNMLNNSFQSFYITGIKLNWNVFDWNKNKTDQKAIDIAKEVVATEKETFELNNKIQLGEMNKEIEKIEHLMQSDVEIISLREKIIKSADAQLKNGVITTSEYLIEFTNLFEAKNILKTHQIQLAFTKANSKIIKGK